MDAVRLQAQHLVEVVRAADRPAGEAVLDGLLGAHREQLAGGDDELREADDLLLLLRREGVPLGVRHVGVGAWRLVGHLHPPDLDLLGDHGLDERLGVAAGAGVIQQHVAHGALLLLAEYVAGLVDRRCVPHLADLFLDVDGLAGQRQHRAAAVGHVVDVGDDVDAVLLEDVVAQIHRGDQETAGGVQLEDEGVDAPLLGLLDGALDRSDGALADRALELHDVRLGRLLGLGGHAEDGSQQRRQCHARPPPSDMPRHHRGLVPREADSVAIIRGVGGSDKPNPRAADGRRSL